MTNDTGTSLIRTYTPVVIGTVVAWLARETGVVIDEDTTTGLSMAFGAFVIALYYGVIRVLEPRFPWLGVLLGLPKQPGYRDAEVPPPQPPPAG